METLGAARGMLMGLRHFAAHPDSPIQHDTHAYLLWLKSLGVSGDIARHIAPIWGSKDLKKMAENIFPPEDTRMRPTAERKRQIDNPTLIPPTEARTAQNTPQVSRRLDMDDPEVLETIRACVESTTPFRIPVCTSLDQALFVQVRRQRGGATAFIAQALDNFLADPVSILAAVERLTARRKGSRSKPTVSARIVPELADRVTDVLQLLQGKVARVTQSKIVGGCVLLLAEENGLVGSSALTSQPNPDGIGSTECPPIQPPTANFH